MIANWQDACGPYLPDDITTPSALEATKTMDQDTCKTIVESCAQSSQSVTSCFSAFSKPADITSCRCQESIVSLASVCKIDWLNSCEGSIAITSDIWEFRNCEAAADVLKTTKVGWEGIWSDNCLQVSRKVAQLLRNRRTVLIKR